MPDELKPCPWCGGCGEIVDAGEPFCAQAQCQSCSRGVVGEFGNIDDAIIAWNALPRQPRWVEFDGTEATLPKPGQWVLVENADYGDRMALEHDHDGECDDVDHAHRYTLRVMDRWMSWPEGGA